MKNDYELVIFDLDGTLLDTSCGILAAVSGALDALHIPYGKELKATEFIGPPIEKALQKHLSLEGEVLQAAAKEFRTQYAKEHLLKATPYEGMERLLVSLRHAGFGRAVATYKREAVAERLLWHCGLAKHFNIIHGTNDAHPQSKADLIRQCVEDYGLCNSRHAVMIGDTDEDASGAALAGVDFIAVTYGFGFVRQHFTTIHPCVGVASTPSEVLHLIKGDTV